MGYYWNADGTPRTLSGHRLVAKTLGVIVELNPTWWFIENVDDAVRDLGGARTTITYCQYGDTRQKPTEHLDQCPLVEIQTSLCSRRPVP